MPLEIDDRLKAREYYYMYIYSIYIAYIYIVYLHRQVKTARSRYRIDNQFEARDGKRRLRIDAISYRCTNMIFLTFIVSVKFTLYILSSSSFIHPLLSFIPSSFVLARSNVERKHKRYRDVPGAEWPILQGFAPVTIVARYIQGQFLFHQLRCYENSTIYFVSRMASNKTLHTSSFYAGISS